LLLHPPFPFVHSIVLALFRRGLFVGFPPLSFRDGVPRVGAHSSVVPLPSIQDGSNHPRNRLPALLWCPRCVPSESRQPVCQPRTKSVPCAGACEPPHPSTPPQSTSDPFRWFPNLAHSLTPRPLVFPTGGPSRLVGCLDTLVGPPLLVTPCGHPFRTGAGNPDPLNHDIELNHGWGPRTAGCLTVCFT